LTRRAGVLLLLAASGLLLYLWPALSAPVVLWSDSALDLEWARQGVGIVSAVRPPPPGAEQPAHPAKPAYLLFLRAVLAIAPSGYEPRTIVVVQSLLLWLSIAATSLFVARRRGAPLGIAVYLLEPATLHVRIASPVLPSPAHFMVLGPNRAVLYTSENDADRSEPAITAPLSQALLDANAAGAVEIEIVTFGSYGEFHYLLFPVIPPP
jgi:hypothetical protein